MAQQQRDRTTLPTEILTIFFQRLNNTIIDRRRLRSVCTAWRTFLTPPKPLLNFPIEICLPPPPPSSPGCSPDSSFWNKTSYLSQSAFYLISCKKTSKRVSPSSSTVWLTRVEEMSDETSTLRSLQNLFSYVTVFQPLPKIKSKVNFLEYNITEVTRSYHLSSGLKDDMPHVVKIVMFPKSGASAEKGFSLLAVYGYGDLGLGKSGADEWITVPKKDNCYFADAVVYENEFYVTDKKGKLMIINPVTFETRDVITSDVDVCDGMFTYLVESYHNLS